MREGPSDLQRRCRWLRTLATALTFAFVLVLAIDSWGSFRSDDLTAYLSYMVPFRLPVLFYLASVWAVRGAFDRLARGELFGQVLPMLLRRMGWAMALGGFTSVFLTQWLWRAFRSAAGGAWAAFDPSAMTVGLVGLLLLILVDLMKRAEAMREELDQFL